MNNTFQKQKKILYSQTEVILYEMDNEWVNSKDILKKVNKNKN